MRKTYSRGVRLLSPFKQTDPFDDGPPPSFLTELLFPLPAHRRTILGIVTWWESRRLLYNVVVGLTGLVTLTVVAIADATAPARLFPSGFGPKFLLPMLAYAVLANVCYTLGPIIEITLERVWGDSADVDVRSIDAHIRRLRAKLGAARDHVETVVGIGYRFVVQPRRPPE